MPTIRSLVLAAAANGLLAAAQDDSGRAINVFFGVFSNNTTPFTLPLGDANTPERQQAVAAKKADFGYALDGFGTSPLTIDRNKSERATAFFGAILRDYEANAVPAQRQAFADAASVASDSRFPPPGTPFESFEQYFGLYDNFKASLPGGPYPGVLSNGSQDLQFSMDRLSSSPLSIRRLAKDAALPFNIEDADATKIAKDTLPQLLTDGRLFYIDHRDQADFALGENLYAGACDAYFFIDREGTFLPLAIRNSRGSNLIYTPLDSPDDWQFAKILFNLNEAFYHFNYQYTSIHELTGALFIASIRTFSDQHPIFTLLARLNAQAFTIRARFPATLVPGGPIDITFAIDGSETGRYKSQLFDNGGGDWRANFFRTRLQNRGMINSTSGPELPDYPFYEDANRLYNAIEAFNTEYVNAFYTSDQDIVNDVELQAFATDAIDEAKIPDFPPRFTTRQELIDTLTHWFHLGAVVHGAVNAVNAGKGLQALPWHLPALYKPVPTEKGITNLLSWLPTRDDAARWIVLSSGAPRPVSGGPRTLLNMFDDPLRLPRCPPAVSAANEKFKAEMRAFSQEVQARSFDANGLSQGAPKLFQELDPLNTPYEQNS